MGVIFISHKLGEVLAVTNRITVMRHGSVVAERANDGSLSQAGARAADVRARAAAAAEAGGRPPARRCWCSTRIATRRGGRVPLARRLAHAARRRDRRHRRRFGQRPARARRSRRRRAAARRAARIEIAGEIGRRAHRRERMQALSIGRVPEDRLTTGMIGAMPLAEVMALPLDRRRRRSAAAACSTARAIRRFAADQIARFDIRTSGPGGAHRHAVGRQSAEGAARARARARSARSCSPRSRRAASTSARPSSSTASSWRCARAAARCS